MAHIDDMITGLSRRVIMMLVIVAMVVMVIIMRMTVFIVVMGMILGMMLGATMRELFIGRMPWGHAARPAPGLLEVIKLIVQVFEEVLHFARGEFLFCRMTAGNQLLFERIQRLNLSVFASEDVTYAYSASPGMAAKSPLAVTGSYTVARNGKHQVCSSGKHEIAASL